MEQELQLALSICLQEQNEELLKLARLLPQELQMK